MTTRQQSYEMIREWLDGELTRLGKKLEVSEQNVYKDGQKKDFLSLEDNQYNVIVQKYVELGKVLTTAQSEKLVKEAQYRQIHEKGMDAPIITSHPLIQQLRQQLIDLEGQVSAGSKIYGSNYPEQQAQNARLREVRERMNNEIKRLETSVKADFETAARTEALLQKDFEAQKSKVVDLQNNLVQHHILKRELQTNQSLYEALLARMKEASVASTMVASNVSVITPAETPYKPVRPRKALYLALGAFIGALGGAVMAFFVEYLDSSIKNVEEMEKICRIPTLGMIPMADTKELAKCSNTPELVAHTDPMSMIGESVFHIRSAIMLSASGAPPQIITITSANPGESKTTTSSNIAAGLAGIDRKCLIMDCDLRKPRLHKVHQKPNGIGLTNYLTGNATLEEIVRPTSVPNLYFIPAGPTPPNPNDLFASSAFKSLIELLRKEYDHIILDSPPIIGFADARSLSSHADGTILVFRHHSTTRESAKLAVQLLAQNNARILGGILTMARKDRMGYGGYYGYYKYYNKYYKDYGSSGETKLVS
ncbi:MAG: polysaccharide biosynthesis tyrosine autokinase [Syntrophobacter sp.]